jgi:hypothetical protein
MREEVRLYAKDVLNLNPEELSKPQVKVLEKAYQDHLTQLTHRVNLNNKMQVWLAEMSNKLNHLEVALKSNKDLLEKSEESLKVLDVVSDKSYFKKIWLAITNQIKVTKVNPTQNKKKTLS